MKVIRKFKPIRYLRCSACSLAVPENSVVYEVCDICGDIVCLDCLEQVIPPVCKGCHKLGGEEEEQ